MKQKIIIYFLLLFLARIGFTQPMPAVSQFDNNYIHLNPAATGSKEVLAVGFTYRKQWTGFNVAPSNQVFSAHAPLKNVHVGLGILLENEDPGNTNYTGIYFNYAYRFETKFGVLSLGVKAGLNAGSQSAFLLRDKAPDPTFDPARNNFVVPNFGVGALLTHAKYWAGISVPRMLGYESKPSGSFVPTHSFSNYEIFIAGGTVIPVNTDIAIEPSAMMKLSGTYQHSFLINALGVYKGQYKAGLGYRSHDAIIITVAYNFNRQFSLSYNYDIAMGVLSDYNSGSHEINLQYLFGYRVNASSPRHF